MDLTYWISNSIGNVNRAIRIINKIPDFPEKRILKDTLIELRNYLNHAYKILEGEDIGDTLF